MAFWQYGRCGSALCPAAKKLLQSNNPASQPGPERPIKKEAHSLTCHPKTLLLRCFLLIITNFAS